ncbi:MAG: hypothetical protein H6823_08905 [Planctomycetaceae bacterium]|nr:hypothetical protein [Planctomycetaceae bacterium]
MSDADSDWDMAQADAQADYDLAVQAAADAWVIAEAAANTAYENSIALAAATWVASEAAAGHDGVQHRLRHNHRRGAMAVAVSNLQTTLATAQTNAEGAAANAYAAFEATLASGGGGGACPRWRWLVSGAAVAVVPQTLTHYWDGVSHLQRVQCWRSIKGRPTYSMQQRIWRLEWSTVRSTIRLIVSA